MLKTHAVIASLLVVIGPPLLKRLKQSLQSLQSKESKLMQQKKLKQSLLSKESLQSLESLPKTETAFSEELDSLLPLLRIPIMPPDGLILRTKLCSMDSIHAVVINQSVKW